jgi:hypothetical protein
MYDDLACLIDQNLDILTTRITNALLESGREPFVSNGFQRTASGTKIRLGIVASCLRSNDVLSIQRHAKEDAYNLFKRGFGYEAFIAHINQLYLEIQQLVMQEVNDQLLTRRYIARLQRMKLLVETTITSVKFRNFSQTAV